MQQETFKSVMDTAASVAIIIAAGAVLFGIMRPLASRPPSEARPETLLDIEPTTLSASVVRNALGSGPIAIVELSDFVCPFCRRHDEVTFPLLKRRFIETGVITYVAVHFPLRRTGSNAVRAAEAAECAAEQGRFWEMRERLFSRPKGAEEIALAAHAEALGLDAPIFSECIGGRKSAVVQADKAEGARLGITGTPSFLLGRVGIDGSITVRRRIDGAVPLSTFETEIANLSQK